MISHAKRSNPNCRLELKSSAGGSELSHQVQFSCPSALSHKRFGHNIIFISKPSLCWFESEMYAKRCGLYETGRHLSLCVAKLTVIPLRLAALAQASDLSTISGFSVKLASRDMRRFRLGSGSVRTLASGSRPPRGSQQHA